MAAPIAAGLIVGASLYYLSRLGPRVARRAAMAQASAAGFEYGDTKPYHGYEYGFQKTMSEREAYLLLGFPESRVDSVLDRPTHKEVNAQFREMIKDFHSDISGSPYLTTKLNQARETLIK